MSEVVLVGIYQVNEIAADRKYNLVKVLDAADLIEPPAKSGPFFMVKINNCPEYITPDDFEELVNRYYDEDGNLTSHTCSKLSVTELTSFDKNLIDNNRFLQLDFDEAVGVIYSRLHGRTLLVEDFGG